MDLFPRDVLFEIFKYFEYPELKSLKLQPSFEFLNTAAFWYFKLNSEFPWVTSNTKIPYISKVMYHNLTFRKFNFGIGYITTYSELGNPELIYYFVKMESLAISKGYFHDSTRNEVFILDIKDVITRLGASGVPGVNDFYTLSTYFESLRPMLIVPLAFLKNANYLLSLKDASYGYLKKLGKDLGIDMNLLSRGGNSGRSSNKDFIIRYIDKYMSLE